MGDLVPIEQKTVLFYEDKITAVMLADGRVFVPVRPLVEHLGVDWSAQSRRIGRDPVLASESISVAIMATDIEPDSKRPRRSTMLCLPLDYISGFLFGINADRVKPELRARVIRYQRECYRVLAEAFVDGRLTAETDFDDLLAQASRDAADAYQMALAVVKLARNQIILESRIDSHERLLAAHGDRLEGVEEALGLRGETVTITEAQASQLSQAVKLVALAYGRLTQRNEFGSVYGQLYRRYDITAYRMLPADRFQDAMAWLEEWHRVLVGEG